MSSDDQSFLHRWARRKRESAQTVAGRVAEAAQPAPELPPIDSLSFESDFQAFMRDKVDEGLRRAALKKLFRDPRFNIMDGLDVYIDDYSKEDPIPPGMLAQLQHARTTLFGPPTDEDLKPEEDTGTRPRPASSNEPSPDHCDADLDSKPRP
jgi:Protein of unknown function (DUF3306)